MHRFAVEGSHFLLDGKPFRILSGAVHYFRVVPAYWKDRLQKLAACGLNTVETVVPWNLHEPAPGQFCFTGVADLEAFIRTAGSLGLQVILRPSPYICAEWDFGGLPAWLLNVEGMEVRCCNKPFLQRVESYYDELFRRLHPLLCGQGGPVIALQIENEYGSYGDDKAYLVWLRDALRKRCGDTLLFTSDGPTEELLRGGTLPDVLKTVNFGSGSCGAFAELRRVQPDAPLVCMEYWNGWFDHWGTPHIRRESDDAAKELDAILESGASVNLYMFHGGTNFGFYSGANQQEAYEPDVTSYDYDAPVSEEGDLTLKYFSFQSVLAKHGASALQTLPPPLPRRAFGSLSLDGAQGLFHCLDALSTPVSSAVPLSMEALGQSFGFVLYRTRVSGPRASCELKIRGLRDRAMFFVNGAFSASLYREGKEQSAVLSLPQESNTLDILVENMGRVNYGPDTAQRKGILDGVLLGCQKHFGWQMYPLALDNPEQIPFRGEASKHEPTFYRFYLETQEPADTYFDAAGWSKGCVFVNGFSLGRYWNIGPQKTLYLPAPLLHKGRNEILVFDLEGGAHPVLHLTGERCLG
ncbi:MULTISPECIES: glycoside hydrolase family 35 protein [Caproicibacterium]|uniref:Beta-galactosidase n=1 Tax=Caproicibacterium argilliputei TaxID=3030016 RepID=A0AA97DBC2_9FIRM|nr:beta-galactosidase [Caproicibacterium argilliputei]WOC32483.1 beta-galactosidase [Caproicibacterium argilliputei]